MTTIPKTTATVRADADDMRAEAEACRRFGIAKREWADNPKVIERYRNVPQSLADIRAGAEVLLRAGDRLNQYATVLDERKGAA